MVKSITHRAPRPDPAQSSSYPFLVSPYPPPIVNLLGGEQPYARESLSRRTRCVSVVLFYEVRVLFHSVDDWPPPYPLISQAVEDWVHGLFNVSG